VRARKGGGNFLMSETCPVEPIYGRAHMVHDAALARPPGSCLRRPTHCHAVRMASKRQGLLGTSADEEPHQDPVHVHLHQAQPQLKLVRE
jgi:hypothetical protein